MHIGQSVRQEREEDAGLASWDSTQTLTWVRNILPCHTPKEKGRLCRRAKN